jgi:homoserine kinase
VANATAGFDVLGFALEQPGDTVIVGFSNEPGIRIKPFSGAYSELPTDPGLNTAGVAIQSLLNAGHLEVGLDVEIIKGVPMVGGMGSSASSGVAAVVAVNELLDLQLTSLELLPHVLESERAATGVPHADNAAPSLLGGFTLVRSVDPMDIFPLATPADLMCVLVHPHMHVKTKYAREILPQSVSMQTATHQMGHIAGFISGLYTADMDLISRSMVDELAEPHRGNLIPGYQAVKDAAIEAGALGCGISGSGPSMFALCNSENKAGGIGEAMQAAFKAFNLDSDLFISGISQQGAHILD